MRMRHIVICGLPRSYNSFSTYLTNGAIFEKKIEHKIYVLSVSTNFVWNIFHSKNNWAKYDKYIGLHVKCPLLLSDFDETWIFWTDFW